MSKPGNRNHLTSGNLAAGIIRLAGPMFVGAILQNVQSLIDLFWVGRLGDNDNAIAALAVSGTLLMTLFPVLMGVATGTVAFVARRVGANEHGQAADGAVQSLILACGLGITAGLMGWLAAPGLARLVGADQQVAGLAVSYLRVWFLGSFTVFLLFIGNSILQGAGNTLIPMCIMGLANVINLVLDPLLIFGIGPFPTLGIRGAALATVLAQAVAAAIVLVILHSGAEGISLRSERWRLRPELMRSIVRIGIPSTGQMLSRSLMGLVLMRIVSGCGAAAVAAYGIGWRFLMIMLMPAFALGNATATMVGQNLGAGNPHRAAQAAWLAVAMDAAIMLAAGAGVYFLAPNLIGKFARSPEVIAIGSNYMRTVAPAFVFVALAVVLGRALQGAGDTVSAMVLTIIPLWGLQVPLAIVLSRVVTPPTQGIWWAHATTMIVHGLLAAAWFMTGRWKTRAV